MKFKTGINRYMVSKPQSKKESFEEDYVTKTIGAFGPMQIVYCSIILLNRCITCWNVMCIVFLTSKTEFACTKFKDGVSRSVENSTCYHDCEEYQYYSEVFQDTLISTFGLICDRAWLVSFTQTMTMLGLAFGVVLLGWLSDRFGRRVASLLSIAFAMIFMVAASFASNYWVYNTFRFFGGFGAGGIMAYSTVYNMEMVGPKYREVVGASCMFADGIGILVMAVVAHLSPTWRTFLLVFGVISIAFFVLMLFVPETPRWLVAERRTEQAIDMMTKVAKLHGLETLQIRDTVTQAVEELKMKQKEVQKRTLLDLFTNVKYAKITVICLFVWFLGGICYFGINHYATMLGLDIFLVVPLMGIFQLLGIAIAMILNKYVGRRLSIFCLFFIIAVMMTILIFIPDGHWGCAVTTGIAIIFAICVFCVFYIHVNEMYPTPLRTMGVGMSAGGSKVGAMVAPFIANMQTHWISSTIFAVVPFVGVALCLLLPETKGKKMKDTVE